MSKLETNTIDTVSGTANLTIGGANNTGTTTIKSNNTAAITVDSSQDVGVGETTPLGKLHVKTGDSGVTSANTSSDELVVEGSGTSGISILSGNGSSGVVDFGDDGDNNIGRIIYSHADNNMTFHVNASEKMRTTSDGDFYVGATSGSIGNSSPGVKIFNTADSTNKSGMNIVTAGGNNPISMNRSDSDGTLIQFKQAGSEEGYISVSGSTVSYSGFTGTHWSRFTDNSKPTILRGTVLETLDEMCDWYNLEFDVTDEEGNTGTEKVPHVLTDTQSIGDVITYNHEGTDYQATIVKEADIKHMKSKVSDTTDAKNVYGVFNCWEQGDEGYNDFLVASVGSFVVRIKSGQTIAKGDLLQSNGDGTAKVQTDDNVKSSSFAKVLSTTVIETYDDGSFIVPCSFMC